MDVQTTDNQFFATISQFKTHDFEDSSNQEMLLLKSLIEDFETSDAAKAQQINAGAARKAADPDVAHPTPVTAEVPTEIAPVVPAPEMVVPMVTNQEEEVPSLAFPTTETSASAPMVAPIVAQTVMEISSPQFQSQPALHQVPMNFNAFPFQLPTLAAPVQTAAFPQDQQLVQQAQVFPASQEMHQPMVEDSALRSNRIPQSCSPQSSAKRIKFSNEQQVAPSASGASARSNGESSRPVRPAFRAAAANIQTNLASDEEATTLDDSDVEASPRSKVVNNHSGEQFPASIHGETRLNIKFLNKGTIGTIPQRFGKSGCIIPDGLSGTHQMYEQRWRFEIHHEMQNNMVLIRWTIHNLTSGKTTSALETTQDALNRDSCGRTICNNVLKKALETRAQEIEEEIATKYKDNPSRANNMRNMVKALRPKRCTVGLLFFGLLHEQIQILMRRQERERKASAAAT